MLLAEGYSMPEVCRIIGVSVSAVGKWTQSIETRRYLPGAQIEQRMELFRERLVEHMLKRSDTFPLPPDELKTLLLL